MVPSAGGHGQAGGQHPACLHTRKPGAVWSLGDIALVTASGGIELRSKTDVLAFIPNAVVGKHWHSILVTIGDGELLIDLKRLDGKVSSHHAVRTTTPMATSSETLILAASGVGPSGSDLATNTSW
jgi:N,N-dimethylformamidase